MRLLDNFFISLQHCEDSTAYLLKSLKLNFTITNLKKDLTEHPDYPSLMCIADVLGHSYNVATLALKVQIEHILNAPSFPVPFLAHIKSKTGATFAVVTKLSKEYIELYDPSIRERKSISVQDFEAIYKGTVLVAEVNENSIEINFHKNVKEESNQRLFRIIFTFIIPFITIISCLATLISNQTWGAVAAVVFVILAFLGAAISLGLTWFEIDQHNSSLIQVCKPNDKINCGAVLTSNASKFLGISWSNWGFSYFVGILFVLLCSGIYNNEALQLAGLLTIIALPYVVFSVFYQWRVIKQWCKLCLIIQIILLLQLSTILIGGFPGSLQSGAMSFHSVVTFVLSFAFALISVSVNRNNIQRIKENNKRISNLKKFKQNFQFFESLLVKQKVIAPPPRNLGITLGNHKGKFKIIKVCNPYCGPCAKSHSLLEELLQANSDLSLQIIFTVSENENDFKRPPVRLLLNIDAKHDKIISKKALDDWYTSKKKDYNTFAKQYVVEDSLHVDENIISMAKWCDSNNIAFTPTFFISLDTSDKNANFYQLPEVYSIKDLKYFLS